MYRLYLHDCARKQLTRLCPDQFETYDDAMQHLADQHDGIDIGEYGFDPGVCEIIAREIRGGVVISEAQAHVSRRIVASAAG